MRCTLLVALLVGFVTLGCASNGDSTSTAKTPTYATFGEAPSQTQAPITPVKALMSNPESYDGKFVRVSGTVAKVCEKKGCWLMLGEGAGKPAMFVKFTCPINDSRLIPMEAVGKEAIVEGKLTIKTISEEEARHYKEDAGASAEEIAKIVGPQKQVTIAAPSAQIADLSQAK